MLGSSGISFNHEGWFLQNKLRSSFEKMVLFSHHFHRMECSHVIVQLEAGVYRFRCMDLPLF